MEQPSPMMPKRTSKIQKTSYRGSLVNEHHLINQQKSTIDLMQNCDLPPPMKVFSGSDKAVMSSVMSSMNRVYYGMSIGREEEGFEYYGMDYDGNNITSGGKIEKLELLKALRLSQTRAREAEERASGLTKERDLLSSAFLEDSLRLLAYRQWVKLLEVQVLKKSEWQRQEQGFCCDCCRKEGGAGAGCGCDGCIGGGGDDGVGVSWFVVIAVCLGIAGVGFAFGCRYSF